MAVVSKQVNMELAKIKQKCPLYEANGQAVSLYCFHEPSKKKSDLSTMLLPGYWSSMRWLPERREKEGVCPFLGIVVIL